MVLDDIKAKRIMEALGDRLPKPKPIAEAAVDGSVILTNGPTLTTTTATTGVVTLTGNMTVDGTLNLSEGTMLVVEGEKKHHTPKFVQHCVTAITEKPKSLDRVQQKKDGSPFAICHAQYNKQKRSLAAKHSQGEHHSVKQYEGALKTLRAKREEAREARPDRGAVVFESLSPNPKKSARRHIRYTPRG